MLLGLGTLLPLGFEPCTSKFDALLLMVTTSAPSRANDIGNDIVGALTIDLRENSSKAPWGFFISYACISYECICLSFLGNHQSCLKKFQREN